MERMRLRFFDLPLRLQIAIPFSILIVALVVLAFGFGLPLARESVQEEATLKLENAKSSFLLSMRQQEDQLTAATASLAQDARVVRALGGVGQEEAGPPLDSLSSGVNVDVVWVYDGTGAVVLNAGEFGPVEGMTEGLRQKALARGSATGLVSGPQGPLVAAARPVRSAADGVEGFVVVGRLLDPLLDEMRATVGAEVSIYEDGRLVACTLEGEHGLPPPEVSLSPVTTPDSSQPVSSGLVVGDRSFTVSYGTLTLAGEPAAAFGVLMPKSDGWPMDRLVAAGVAGVLVVCLIFLVGGFFIARRIAARLEGVVDVVEKVGEGDLSQRVNVDSSDEVGRLGQMVNSMAQRLQEVETGKAEFLAMASHELRTPLALMKSSTELLLDGFSVSASQSELLQIVADNIERMNRRVSDLLDLARLEAGHFSLKKRPTDLCRLTRDVAESSRPMLTAKDQTLSLDVPRRLPSVEVDPDRIQQVLLNLLSNASRHTPSETHVVVRVAESRERVVVEVQDNGPGIPLERLERLFDRSRQPWRGDGVGLGLVIAQRLVHLHGGEIWAKSQPGEGTLVAFSIPRGGRKRGRRSHEDPSS